MASDNLKSTGAGRVGPRATSSPRSRRRGWAFDPERGTGATLHLLGALVEHGKMGVTCIGDSDEEADELYREVVAALA